MRLKSRQEIIGIVYGTLDAHDIGKHYPVDDIIQIAEDIHHDLKSWGLMKRVVE